MFFRAVSQEAEVTDAHEAIGQDVEQEAADEFVGIKDDGLFSIPIFSISVTQGDLAVLDLEDAVIGESDTVGVAAEVIENGVRRAEGLFRVDDPILLAQGFDFLVGRSIFPRSHAVLTDQETFLETPGSEL